MASTRSAGLLMYRRGAAGIEVLLAHPGGPYWARKDEGAWSLPKGEYDSEEPLAAAQREFSEETGLTAMPPFLALGEVRQKSGKHILAWAFEGDCDPGAMRCNTFEMEWPPRSGRLQAFPEVDRLQWFTLEEARHKLIVGQIPLLDALSRQLARV